MSPAPLTARPAATRERATWLAAALLTALFMTVAWLSRPPGVLTGADDAVYLSLARSLRSLDYHEAWRMDRPIHALYPPGYPAVLALAGAVVRDRFDALVALNIAAFALALLLTYDIVRRLLSPGGALLALSALAVNPLLIERAGILMAEPTFALWSVVAVWALSVFPERRAAVAAAGGAALAAALTRSIGVTLVVALVAWLLWRRRWVAAAVYAVAATAVLTAWFEWVTRAHAVGLSATYVADAVRGAETEDELLSVVANRALPRLTLYATRALPSALAMPTVAGTYADNAIVTLLLAVGLGVGLVALAKRGVVLLPLYLVAYGSVLVFWPWVVTRFLVPVVPLLVLVLMTGVATAAKPVRGLRAGVSVAVVAGLLVVGSAPRAVTLLRRQAGCSRGGEWPDERCLTAEQIAFFRALRYVRRHVPSDAVLLSSKGATVFHYTGRRTVRFGLSVVPPGQFLDSLRASGAEWVLANTLASRERRELGPRLIASCRSLDLAASFPPHSYLFRLRRSDQPPAQRDSAACRSVARYRPRSP